MNWYLVLLTFIFYQEVFANDLESLLSGGASQLVNQGQSNSSSNPDLLADTLRSQMKNTPSVDQNVFLMHLMNRKYEEALITMASAFGLDASSYNPNLKAVRSYLLFVCGLKVTAIEELFSIQNLDQVHFYILNRWKEILPDHTDPVWTAAQFQWNPEFTKVFGTTLEARVGLAQVKTRSDISKLKDLTLKVMDQSPEKSLVNWSLALAYLGLDQNQEAAKLISVLLKDKNSPVPQDYLNMTAARMLYQAGSFDGAISYYQKIPKKSDLWIMAQEELAWSYLRKGEPQNALAVGITITNPLFKGWAGPEAYLVTAIASLRVCDYPEVVNVLDRFSTAFKSRVAHLSRIADGDVQSKDIQSLLQDIRENPNAELELTRVGSRIHHVPLLLVTNRSIREWLKSDVALETEMAQAGKLYARSLAFTGLQGQFETLKNRIANKKAQNIKQVYNLIQNLAKNEVGQIKQTLAKMHIIEAELLTHVTLADRLLAGNTVNKDLPVSLQIGNTGSQEKFSMKFRKTDELWFDEIGNYKVDVKKACQQKKADLTQ